MFVLSWTNGCQTNWMKTKRIIIMKSVSHFSITLWHVMRNGYYMTTNDVQGNGWIERKFLNSFKRQSFTKRFRHFGGLKLVWFNAAFESWRNNHSWEVLPRNCPNAIENEKVQSTCTMNTREIEWIVLWNCLRNLTHQLITTSSNI